MPRSGSRPRRLGLRRRALARRPGARQHPGRRQAHSRTARPDLEIPDTIQAVDAAVLARLVQQNRAAVSQDLDAICTRIARNAISEDYPRVVKELSDRYAEHAQVIVEALQHFRADDFGKPDKILGGSETAAVAWHATNRAIAQLDDIRTLIVSIDAQAINNVAYFADLGDGATGDTLPTAAGIYHRHGPESWVRLFAVVGIVPALHDRDGAAKVSSRGAELLATAPKQRKLAGQW